MFSFLDVFEGKPDHPMFDAKQAKKLLGDLSQQDASKALTEIANWLRSVKDTAGFHLETRIEVLMLLDEAGVRFYEQLLQDYVGAPHVQDFKGRQLWQLLHDFKVAVAEAYILCIDEYRLVGKPNAGLKRSIPFICARLLRALSEQMQLRMMRYEEVDQVMWDSLYRGYQFSLTHQTGSEMVQLYPAQVEQTSPHREFLRVLMLYLASPSTLSPDQILACSRMTGHLFGTFDCKTDCDDSCLYFVDLEKPSAPRKIAAGLQTSSSMRFLGADKTILRIADIIEQERGSSVDGEASGRQTVLKHLQLYWSRMPPARREVRHQVTGSLSVAHGIAIISQLVTRIDHGSLVNLPTEASKGNAPLMGLESDVCAFTPIETWTVSDISEKGVGGIIPKSSGAWVKVGDLCGLKLQDSHVWWVGMVRRLRQGNDGMVHVGIEILAKKPLAVLLRDRTGKSDKMYQWDVSTDSIKYRDIPVILLPDSNNSYAHATMLMARGNFVTDAVYELLMGAKNRFIKLTGLFEEGGDYERANFILLNQGMP
jgi:hypothetical protein